MYYVYIVRCADGTLYTGITTDIARRLQEHNSARIGAKYTRARLPVTLVYTNCFATRSEASVEEGRIKKLRRAMKESLIEAGALCDV
jgi:putative endonuclease